MFPCEYKHSVSLERTNEKTGSVDLRTIQRGRKAALTEKALHDIDQRIIEQPDITIDKIIKRQGLSVSSEAVRKASTRKVLLRDRM